MKLEDLIKGLEYIKLYGKLDVEVDNLTIDSRKVSENYMYGAIKGFTVDGHKFIDTAVSKGASLILCEDDIDEKLAEFTAVVKVENTRVALSKIAQNFYNNPTEKINLIGITGTNGKTSSSYFMEQILQEYNKSTGVIGTIETRINQKKVEFDFSTSTTPDTIELNELFNKMIYNDVENVIMEVSSHALELSKVDNCNFETAIFTNLTQDHLDLHKNMGNYCEAKSRLFKMCKNAVVNADDDYCDKILENSTCRVLKYSIKNESDLQAINIKYFMDKVEFDILIDGKEEHFILNVPAKFSVYNALGVIGASILSGIPIDTIKEGIANIRGVAGRIQNIPNNRGFNVFVDYAHTPDGLSNIIKAVKEFTKGEVITVFGCGGDRDKTKRPIMGRISGELSNYTIITSDNPRSEVPETIIDEIEAGVLDVTKNYEKIVDRKDAIYRAVAIAKPLDSIIIAGKGHENYEIFKDRTIHFDDTEVAKKALEDNLLK